MTMHSANQTAGADITGQKMRTDDSDIPVQTTASLGMMSCHHCGTMWQEVKEHERCARFNRTWALLTAACIMYIPANLMPVMITRTLRGGVQQDTIMSGVIYFWVSGAWELAAIIFIASFLIPLFKISAMILMTLMAQRRSRWRRLQRAKLYRIVEVIGRWSMLDVFVVSLLAGLVQIEGFARITAGAGVAAFSSVVVLTMLASLSFDPRLTWDTTAEGADRNPEQNQLKAQDE
jgi:paraquat-inducible protein A